MVPGPLTAFLAARQELIASAPPGTAAAQALSDLTDDAVRRLAASALAESREPVAIFAMGGWGAQRLLPHSDLDVLVVTRASRVALDPLVRALLYPLWDAGFVVGHQIRSPNEHVAAVAGEIESLTSFLSARNIAGDGRLAERVSKSALSRLRGRGDAAAGRVGAALAALQLRERPGSPYLLEPDLKDGAGGQRDIDELVWSTALLAGERTHDVAVLARLGLLTSAEETALVGAQDAITAARWRLHAGAARATNTMAVDAVESVGIDADGVQRALAICHNILLDVRERLPAGPTTEDRLSATAIARLADGREAFAIDTRQLTLDDLAACAATGTPAAEEFERAVWAGRFENAAPGFRDLMVLRRPALTHRYTVGAHCVRALAGLGDREPGILGITTDAPHARALLVAALTHDVGKRVPGAGHPARGAIETRQIARRLGLLPAEADAAATLVVEHLLLPEVALTQDLSNEDVVLEAAAHIREASLVAPLYQLSVADMRATGPGLWTPWRTARMGDLATKLEAALSPDVDGAGIVASAEETRAEAIRRAASVGASRSVLDFLQRAPLRYLATRSADAVLRDARLVQSLTGPGGAREIAFAVRPGPTSGTYLLDVVTRDRSGLFASIAGAIELTGLAVLSAEAITGQAGVALDTFTVTSATRATVAPATWEAFGRNLRESLSNHGALINRLTERRRHYERQRRAGVPVRVHAGPRGSFSTTITVRSADRIGLLYDLAHVLEEADLDIRHAIITTAADRADDTFEVTDAEGAPPDPEKLTRDVVPDLERAARSR